MDGSVEQRRSKFLINSAFWVVIIAIVFLVMKYMLNIIMPFFIALIFAALARPVARFLSSGTRTVSRGKNKGETVNRKSVLPYNVAAVVGCVCVFVVLVALATLIAAPVISFIADKVHELEPAYNDFVPEIEDWLQNLSNLPGRFDDTIRDIIEDMIPNLISSLGSVVTNVSAAIITWVSSIATSLPKFLLNSLICLIATVFIALDYDRIAGFIRLNLRSDVLQVTNDVKNSLIDIVWRFIKSYFFIFLITSAEITLGLTLLKVDNPLLFGVLIAIFDAFPIVGSGMILLPWSVITLISSGTLKGLGMLALYLTVVIVRQIIEPRIVGRHVGLRPIVTLFCMYVGTKLFGGLGLFALPIAAAIIADLNDDGSIHFFTTIDAQVSSGAADSSPEVPCEADSTAPPADE